MLKNGRSLTFFGPIADKKGVSCKTAFIFNSNIYSFLLPSSFCPFPYPSLPPSSLPPSLPSLPSQQNSQAHNCKQVYAPPYILSPSASISSSGPLHGAQIHQVLFAPEEAVLFCGYCVSPDQRWLLATCCDRQGELLDSTIIGIQASR